MMVAGEVGIEREESIAKMPPLLDSMQPPTEEEARHIHLDRTLRIVPHDQDMGGFFVALLEKVSLRERGGAQEEQPGRGAAEEEEAPISATERYPTPI